MKVEELQMAAVTAAMVKELREMTGAGMMDCKKALANTDGDMDKAVEYLRENSIWRHFERQIKNKKSKRK